MKLTTGQLYLLQHMAAADNPLGSVSPLWHKPSDAPTDAGMSGLTGLARRGFVARSAHGVFYITNAGRQVAKDYAMCPACSRPVKAVERQPRHKCEHGINCTPASVDPDTRLPTSHNGLRSRTCDKCNYVTMLQKRIGIGERSRDDVEEAAIPISQKKTAT